MTKTMANNKYAIFGATGKSGSALIEVLLASSPDNIIHAYCRNAAKLTNLFPEAVNSKRIVVFEGNIHDVKLFAECVRGCGTAFLSVTMNDNIPYVHVAEDTARTIITALQQNIRADSQLVVPKLVVLSSASLEPSMCQNLPRIFHWIVTHANSHVYEDLRRAERALRAEGDWVSSIFIKPGGLSVDEARGYKLNLYEQDTFVSYKDLAGAMIEAGSDPDGRYDMKDVSVNNLSGSARFPPTLPLLALSGLLRCFFPWLHPYMPYFG
ncbi:hypothetical protein BKA67DRAFT_558150 [Truncatella angustata]|uniref:NAD(P)-binding domain-containing protein n=1 Tax=Truncatella angustata TaxID=152316 RepID=A0A9P8UUL2_9PEZI|nr:uncharacterized protein BKA67DRAFT_558150 [Truncatella angustata]KAH6658471.1 hypothetical protein BKA67DRAFT_558150 [Truncatella angustata]KAH8195387.1 hypothetical protein TruAng_010444 [Truncatella angustata]